MRRAALLVVLLSLIAGLACAGPALAAGQHADKAGAAHDAEPAKHGGDHKGGGDELPAILDLAIWTIVVFLILFFVLRRFAWGPMLEGLKKREESIRGALAEAAKARDEAHGIRLQLQQEMGQAQQKVKAIIDEAKRDAQSTAEEMIAKAKADIGQERERLHREIQVETDQALQTLWTHAAELATQVSAKAIGRQLDGELQHRLIDEALADLQKSAGRGNGHA
ncbi:MAG TPA: F0F1 ATP synthase subunit B [Gemmataceae bacterium]|jgi:F-type H+-transporting ATPase subunit b|nr:F0F1 ATP synthase subunit B [Gemmataceae bacterium]